MKNSLPWMVLLLVSATLQHCTKEGESLSPQKIQFSCNLPAIDNAGGRIQSGSPPTALLLSLENNAHAMILTRKVVKLLRVGDSFMTEPLELLPGGYQITDFFIMDDTGLILYATPRAGSPLASTVSHPLPYGFTLSKDNVSNVDVEVVDVSRRAPEDFGYFSFGIHVVNPLSLSVFITEGDQANLTSAKAYILKDNDTIQSYSLDAKINLISFKGDPASPHTLVVVKDGYAPYSKDFIYNDLVAMLGSLPLKIFLARPFSMLAYVSADDGNSFEIGLNGISGSLISVNWGDGSSTAYSFTPETAESGGVRLNHTYSASGNFPVTVTGDIDKITTFSSFYGQGMMDAINLQGLTQLKDMAMGLTRGPSVIDLSHNTSLVSVRTVAIFQLEHLILPAENNFEAVEISGPIIGSSDAHYLSTDEVDDIVNKVYHTAVLNHTVGGGFIFAKDWTNTAGEMLGPPSPSSLVKLRELRDTYHWTVRPDPGS